MMLTWLAALGEALGGGLRRTGVPAHAIVRRAVDTGRSLHLNPVYDVTLAVTPGDGPSYETTVASEVNALAVAQCVPGSSVPVRIDPNDPGAVWIDWLAVADITR